MTPTERDRLGHILEAAQDALSYVARRSRADLSTDSQLRRAVINCFTVMGEAAVHISPGRRASLPGVPWRDIRRMRNVVVHAYSGIDLDIVWDTTLNDLRPLIAALEKALAEQEGG